MSRLPNPVVDDSIQIAASSEIIAGTHVIKWRKGDFVVNCDLDICEIKLFRYDEFSQCYIYRRALWIVGGKAHFNLVSEKEFLRTEDIRNELERLDISANKGSPLPHHGIKSLIDTYVLNVNCLSTEDEMTSLKFLTYRDLCEVDLRESQQYLQWIIPFDREYITNLASHPSATIEPAGKKSQLVIFRELVVLKILNALEYFEEDQRSSIRNILKTMEAPERLLAGIITSYLSVQRFEIIKKYVFEKLSINEQAEFYGTLTMDEFLQVLTNMESRDVYGAASFKRS